jgi:hypothetical protein
MVPHFAIDATLAKTVSEGATGFRVYLCIEMVLSRTKL